MGQPCQQQQRPAASPERSKAGHGRALPSILLLIILLLASSVSAGQGEHHPARITLHVVGEQGARSCRARLGEWLGASSRDRQDCSVLAKHSSNSATAFC